MINKKSVVNIETSRKINKTSQKIKNQPVEWQKRIVKIRKIVKVVKGGKKYRYGIIVAVGDEKGQVGLGIGKAEDVVEAVDKATNDAKRHLIKIPLTKNYSIPYIIRGRYGAARIIIKPGNFGSGIFAGGSVRAILELSGIQNISAKQLRCDNLLNNGRAAICALNSIANN
jgi:small subunit ribosomal protein S5